jgi:hypothetical protein
MDNSQNQSEGAAMSAPFKKFRVNTSGEYGWGYFTVWSSDAAQCRTRTFEEDCRQFIEDAIREKLEREEEESHE